jgi:hypothetical protein
MILPFYILFLLIIIWLNYLIEIEVALREAVAETVKVTASYAYPAPSIINEINFLERDLSSFLPSYIREFLSLWNEMDKGAEASQNLLWSSYPAFESGVESLVMNHLDKNERLIFKINPNRLSIRSVAFPNFMNEDEHFFGITIEYRQPFPLPWLGQEINLSASAIERCWVGGQPQLGEIPW